MGGREGGLELAGPICCGAYRKKKENIRAQSFYFYDSSLTTLRHPACPQSRSLYTLQSPIRIKITVPPYTHHCCSSTPPSLSKHSTQSHVPSSSSSSWLVLPKVPAFLLPLIPAGLLRGPQGLLTIFLPKSPALQRVHVPLQRPPTRTQLPAALRLSSAPSALRCPRPRSFTRRPRDVPRSPRTWRPALLNHPPTTPLPPSRHFRPQRPHAQPLPVVRKSCSGESVDSNWTLVDFKAAGVI